jgi:C1A family cysteine protease
MGDSEHTDIRKFQAENERLKQQLVEQQQAAEALTIRRPETLEELRNENISLRESLLRYRSLEEELAVQRVFEKSKKKVLQWVTFGGSVLTLASALGWLLGAPQVRKYATEQVDAQVQKVTGGQVNRIVEDRINKAVAPQLTDLSETLNATIHLASLPDAKASAVDYTSQMETARNQGSEGSTTGFALAAAMEYQIRKRFGEVVVLSPRWIYNQTRKVEGTAQSDLGSKLEDAIGVARDIGVIDEEAWPYKAGEYASPPPAKAEAARRYKIRASKRLSGLREIKAALENSGPLVAGITLYQSAFEQFAKTGRLPPPNPKDNVQGAQAFCVVGFDDQHRMLKVLNSWGAAWGDHGYGYVPYSYVDENLSEFWAIAM